MNSVDVKSSTYIDSRKESKVTLQICLKKFLRLKKLNVLCHGHILLMILTGKNLLKPFTKKNSKKRIKEILELKNQSKEKLINFMLNGKDTKIIV